MRLAGILFILGLSISNFNVANNNVIKRQDTSTDASNYTYSFLKKTTLDELGLSKISLPDVSAHQDEEEFIVNGLNYGKNDKVIDIVGVDTATSTTQEIVYGIPLILDGETRGTNKAGGYYNGTNFPNAKTFILDDQISSFDGFNNLETLIYVPGPNATYPLFNLELPSTIKNIIFMGTPQMSKPNYISASNFNMSNLTKNINYVCYESNKYSWANIFNTLINRDDYEESYNFKLNVLSDQEGIINDFPISKEFVSGGVIYTPIEGRNEDKTYYPIGTEKYIKEAVYSASELGINNINYLVKACNYINYDILYVNQIENELNNQGYYYSTGNKIIYPKVSTFNLKALLNFKEVVLGKPYNDVSLTINNNLTFNEGFKIYIPEEYSSTYNDLITLYPSVINYYKIDEMDLTPRISVSYNEQEESSTDYLNVTYEDLINKIVASNNNGDANKDSGEDNGAISDNNGDSEVNNNTPSQDSDTTSQDSNSSNSNNSLVGVIIGISVASIILIAVFLEVISSISKMYNK